MLCDLGLSTHSGRALWRIPDQKPNLAITNLMTLGKDILWLRRSTRFCTRYTIPGERLIPAPGINAKNAADIVTISRDGELAVGISPFIEEITNCFSDLVFAILGVVTCPCDGVDGLDRFRMLEENSFEVLHCFFRMQSMKVDVDLGVGTRVLVSLFIELPSRFSVGFSHEIVFALTSEA
jgi:hypothetical protein